MSIEGFDDMTWASLQDAASEPVSWWNLELKKDEIKVASYWTSYYQWALSFFSSQLKIDLRERVAQLLPTRVKSPEQRIVFEKISRLVHSSTSWLKGAVPVLPNPKETTIRDNGHLRSSFQPHEKDGVYYNHPGEGIWKQFIETLRLLFPGAWSSPSNEDLKTWNQVVWKATARSIDPKITWLGHAGLLIQAQNINLLFDPSFNFVAPCFLRHTAPPIPFKELPLIDVLSVSHNHADHCEVSTIEKLSPYQPVAFVPHGVDEWFAEKGYEKAEGKKWWHKSVIERDGRTIKLTAVPAQHGSCTSFSNLNHTLWMGVMIEIDDYRIYFAGDTGYNKEMLKEVKRRFGTIDVACLPIAPENEPDMHLDHKDALSAFEVLKAKTMIPIHHGAYRTGPEKIEDPLNKLMEEADRRHMTHKITSLKLGETLDLREAAAERDTA